MSEPHAFGYAAAFFIFSGEKSKACAFYLF